MKKMMITALLASALLSGCAATEEHHYYAASGYYYTDGTIITDDGNIWDFQTDAITENETRVKVVFDNNGTPKIITDDIIRNVTAQNN